MKDVVTVCRPQVLGQGRQFKEESLTYPHASLGFYIYSSLCLEYPTLPSFGWCTPTHPAMPRSASPLGSHSWPAVQISWLVQASLSYQTYSRGCHSKVSQHGTLHNRNAFSCGSGAVSLRLSWFVLRNVRETLPRACWCSSVLPKLLPLVLLQISLVSDFISHDVLPVCVCLCIQIPF